MKQLYQLCPNCQSWQKATAKFCADCAFKLPESWTLNLYALIPTLRTVLLTASAIFGVVLIASIFYYLGSKSRYTGTLGEPARNAQPTLSIPTPAPTVSPQANNTITANVSPSSVNTIVKKSETNSNTQPKEKKRPLSDGYAVGWSYLTETSESSYGFYYFYKEDSITVETSTVVVWARKYPMFPKGFAKRNEVTTPVDYSVEKIRFNCKDGNFYILNETLFDASGNSIDGKSGYRTVQTVVPGTLTETLQQRVCSVY